MCQKHVPSMCQKHVPEAFAHVPRCPTSSLRVRHLRAIADIIPTAPRRVACEGSEGNGGPW